MLAIEKYWIEIKYLVHLECIKVCLYRKLQFSDNTYKTPPTNISRITKKLCHRIKGPSENKLAI